WAPALVAHLRGRERVDRLLELVHAGRVALLRLGVVVAPTLAALAVHLLDRRVLIGRDLTDAVDEAQTDLVRGIAPGRVGVFLGLVRLVRARLVRARLVAHLTADAEAVFTNGTGAVGVAAATPTGLAGLLADQVERVEAVAAGIAAQRPWARRTLPASPALAIDGDELIARLRSQLRRALDQRVTDPAIDEGGAPVAAGLAGAEQQQHERDSRRRTHGQH